MDKDASSVSDDLSLVLGTHMVKGEDCCGKIAPVSPHIMYKLVQ